MQDVGGAGQLHAEAGVEHVRTGHALVDETRFGADMFGEVGEEGDDIVLGFALDLVDAGDLELAAFPNCLGGIGGDDAERDQRVHGVRLDLEPDLEAGFGFPDGNHLGAGIAGDHAGAPLSGAGVSTRGGGMAKRWRNRPLHP